MKRYVLFNLIALDQAINTLFGGYPDETISARSWRCREHKVWWLARKAIDGLFFWQQQHCRAAYLSELRRKHLHKDYQ